LTPISGDRFRFSCHRGIECFNKCCRDLRMVLSPYDILRMKRRLGLSSEEFLEMYTTPEADDTTPFPLVKLKMDVGTLKCPFVSPEGCTIYDDRPGPCRTYPLGRAASAAGGSGVRESYFIVKEPHCLGHREEREWSIEEWKQDQGIGEYNEMNDRWTKVLTHPAIIRHIALSTRKLQMFYMVSYNLERFRDFVFQTRFLDLFEVPGDTVQRIKTDEVELLKFGIEWLRFSLFGEDTIKVKKEGG